MKRHIETFCEIIVKFKYSKELIEGVHKREVDKPVYGKAFQSINFYVSINNGDGKGWNWYK